MHQAGVMSTSRRTIERTAGLLASPVRMCDRAKCRRRETDGTEVRRVVNKAGRVPVCPEPKIDVAHSRV